MRWVTASCCVVALVGAACASGRERADPRDLVRPAPTATTDGGDGIEPPEPAACGEFCGETFLHEALDPPNLYFLVDRSGSMGALDEGQSLTRYDMARKVLGDLLRVIGHRVRFGASVFPAVTDADYCGPGVEVFEPTLGGLPSCDGDFDPVVLSFLTRFGAITPGGSTPTSAAFLELGLRLAELEGKTHVVLLTDGAPNCNFAASCAVSECSLNIEGATVGKRACTPDFNCCDPDNTGPAGPTYCVDVAGTEQAIAALADAGISTYVVGMPGAERYAAVLERLAVAGGTARDGVVGYYAVRDQDELEDALYAIGTGVAIRCTIELETEPEDPAMVNVYFDGELVPADPEDGWSWEGGAEIRVHGDACARLKSGEVIDARAVFGCDTVVR